MPSLSKFFMKLDFIVNIRRAARRAFLIIKEPSMLAELDSIRDGFIQWLDAPSLFLQLVGRHRS
jgi:hypothetical protein